VASRAVTEGHDAPFLYRTLDAVIDRHGGHEHDGALKAARAEFEARRGRIFEDEPLWEEWTQAFLEWFAVERPWDGGPSPAARAMAGSSERDRAALGAWLSSQRALAEVRGLSAGRVELVDLLGGASFAVSEDRALHGVRAGDLVEVRLVGFEGAVRFGRTFVYHPRGARDAVAAHVRAAGVAAMAGAERRAVLDGLAALRVKVERYRHVDPARVYEAELLGRPAARGEP
jgi:hypothetical protein